MAYQEIVVHQGLDQRTPDRLELSAHLAQTHEARLIGVHTAGDLRLPSGVWPSPNINFREELETKYSAAIADVEAKFSDCAQRYGVRSEWRTVALPYAAGLTQTAHCSDLVVIGQADPDEPIDLRRKVEAVVLGAGGPVLVIPYAGRFKTVGRRVMVAWNGSRESARAVRDALPILADAEEVVVFQINPPDPDSLAGVDLAEHLARHGVRTTTSRMATSSRTDAVDAETTAASDFGFSQHGGVWHGPTSQISDGNALLDAVSDAGVDMLVMGAYGHARLRELVLGGVTQHILREMTVPVLMSH